MPFKQFQVMLTFTGSIWNERGCTSIEPKLVMVYCVRAANISFGLDPLDPIQIPSCLLPSNRNHMIRRKTNTTIGYGLGPEKYWHTPRTKT